MFPSIQVLIITVLGYNSRVLGLSPDQHSFFVKEGGKVELDCRPAADSHPPAGIIWYKYNIPVQDISYRSFTADVLNLSKIALDNLLVADSGNYSCSFNNTEMTFNRTFILRVFEPCCGPAIVEFPNTTASLGSEVNLRCHVTSDSVVYIRWYFKLQAAKMNASNSQTLEDLREISSILPVKIFSYGDSSFKGNLNRVEAVYHIDNVSFADQGEYICEAFDEHGKVRKGTFLKVFNGTESPARDLEAKCGRFHENNQTLPLAMLIVVPAAFLVVFTVVFVRALDKIKQKRAVLLKSDVSRNGRLRSGDFNGNNGCPSQNRDKRMIISHPHQTIPNSTTLDRIQNAGQLTVLSALKDTCDKAPCNSFPSSRLTADVMVSGDVIESKHCSEALELEWEGMELVMDEKFEAIKLCKEEEV
ncbi:fibroblast growth factor receptor 3-like [Acropora palmata]|uniref:fibroblast growth factor receptor 3-like n=1 Tax=Acropora palmata TaxID=6131 RepID=UPI003DA18035